MHHVYILECADKTLYIGYTTNIAKRVAAHNSGKTGAKYTRARRPVRLVYSRGFRSLSKALQCEHAMKQWSRAEKLRFIGEQSAST